LNELKGAFFCPALKTRRRRIWVTLWSMCHPRWRGQNYTPRLASTGDQKAADAHRADTQRSESNQVGRVKAILSNDETLPNLELSQAGRNFTATGCCIGYV